VGLAVCDLKLVNICINTEIMKKLSLYPKENSAHKGVFPLTKTKYFTRKPELCLNEFKVRGRESCTSIGLTSSAGMTLTQLQDMGQKS